MVTEAATLLDRGVASPRGHLVDYIRGIAESLDRRGDPPSSCGV